MIALFPVYKHKGNDSLGNPSEDLQQIVDAIV